MKDKEKQIWQDVANVMCECEDKENFTQKYRTKCRGCGLSSVIRHIVFFLNNSDYRKISEDSVVLSREEYDELINLQRTHAEDLTKAKESYEESKADLKIEYDNHIKNLEKIIDRQSKDLNSQANRLIDLKAELENKGKETAAKIADFVFDYLTTPEIWGKLRQQWLSENGNNDHLKPLLKTPILEKFGVEIKE